MKEKIATLISYIDKEWEIINELIGKLEKAGKGLTGKSSHEKVVFNAYLLHNIYSALEDMFKNIGKTFENNIDDTSQYHIELLKKMNMPVYKIRPQLLNDRTYAVLNEVRKFRHVFRYAYEYELDGDRISVLAEKLLKNKKVIHKDILKFKKFLIDAIKQ